MKKLIFLLLLLSTLCHAQTYVSSFGALHDGTNQTTNLQKALNSANSDIWLEGPGFTYLFSKLKILDGRTLHLNGSTLKLDPAASQLSGGYITASGSLVHTAAVTLSIDSNSHSFTYSGASSIHVGDIVELDGDEYANFSAIYGKNYPYSKGWYSLVTNVSGTSVTLSDGARAGFTARTIKVYKTVTVGIVGPGILDYTGRTTGFGVDVSHSKNLLIQDLTVKGDGNLPIALNITGVRSVIQRDTVHGVQTNTSVGYDINIKGTENQVLYCYAYDAKHAITSTGSYYYSDTYVAHNTVFNCHIPMDFHGNSGGTMEYNTITAMPTENYAVNLRASRVKFLHNTVTMTRQAGVTVRATYNFECGVDSVEIGWNTFIFLGTGGTAYMYSNSSGLISPSTRLYIHDNVSSPGSSIHLVSGYTSSSTVTNNVFDGTTTPPPVIVVVDTVTTIPDQPPVTPVQWKDTTTLSTSYTMPKVPVTPVYQWTNTTKGGILNLPDPSTVASTFTFTLINYTKQPIQCNRYLYTNIGKNWKSSTWKGSFLAPKTVVKMQSGKYKITTI